MKITIDSIKKTTLLICGLLLAVLAVDADNTSGLTTDMLRPQFSNLTPEAASLGRYGAFQVSEYSGTANISIPLYTVKSGDVSFPITLYYDATGIKVEQDATMVGLGWNLSYGGMISHITCGEDDFREYHGYPEFDQNWWKKEIKDIEYRIPNDAPWYWEDYKNKWLGETFPHGAGANNLYINGGSDRAKDLQVYANMTKGYDVPDVYQASFCGHNISFVIDKRRGIDPNSKVYPITILNNNPQKYKISYKSENNKIPSSFHGYPTSFEIIDDKGITYCFEGKTENILTGLGIDSYYLTKIYGLDGKNGKSLIKFWYETKNIYFGDNGKSRNPTKDHKPRVKRIHKNGDYISSQEPSLDIAYRNLMITPSWSVEVACNTSNFCQKIYPQSIVTAFDSIEFDKGERKDLDGAMKIDTIIIHSKIGNAKKYIYFNYGYFSETPAFEHQRKLFAHMRLKLTDLTIDTQKYMFEYNDSVLPSFYSYSKDYWGYYNGENKNDYCFVGCSPAYTISNGKVVPVEQHLDGSNRLASEKLCKVGMLKKIIYPTGGYTLYEFEANRFNDQYYYPDASKSNISFPPPFTTTTDGSIYMYGTGNKTMTFKASQSDCNLTIIAKLCNQSENLTVTIKNNSDSVVKTVTYKGSKEIGDTIALSLTKDSTYTVEAELNATQANRTSTAAQCSISHDIVNTNRTASPSTKDENGGYSIGGGLRVRTIKNYDSDGTYLNGLKYEYSGGKLLSPTVHMETHYVNFRGSADPGPIPTNFSFNYANTEPSYLYICSLGIPATVGYDKVVKKEIDEKGNVTYRKTVLDFHNYGYDTSTPAEQINTLMQNAFYYLPYNQGHLNGMIKMDSVLVDSVLASTTKYVYDYTPLDTIYYQKCLPLHLPNVEGAGKDYYLTFFRKCNTWTYLTSKTETLYDSNGKQTTSNTTLYDYNSSNYQLSQQTVSNGVDSVRTNYWYPSDKKVEGYDELNKIHNISEVTAIDTYRNGTFTGGNKYSYAKKYSSATKKYYPVVYRCFSVLPNESKSSVIEMTVTSWDGYGNIREYQKKDGTPVTVIWSYNHQLPIMEIVGCKYADACKLATSIPTVESQTNVSDNTIASIHSKLQNDLKDAYVTAYIYGPWHTVTQIIKPNGDRLKYSYDKYGRLEKTSDVNNKILQKYFYNYKNK